MRYRKTLTLSVFILINLSFSVLSSTIDMDEDSLYLKFLAELNGFAKNNGLDNEKLSGLLGKVVLNEEKFAKGGIGIIRKNLFVKLNEPRNAIILNDESWEGRASDRNEIVIVDGNKIINITDNHELNLDKLVIIIFSKDEIRYIDLDKMSGGKYIRH